MTAGLSNEPGSPPPDPDPHPGPDPDPASEPDGEDPRGDLRWGTIPRLVADAAARFGDAEAVVDHDSGVRLSFRQLEEAATDTTRAAVAAGLSAGDRVGLWAPNIVEWVVAALGLLGAGAVLVPLNTRYKGQEAADILRRSGARLLFTVRGFLGNDYLAMLEGEDLPDLDRIVLLRDDGPATTTAPVSTTAPASPVHAGEQSECTVTDEIPVYDWAEFLQGADGVVESPLAHAGVKVPPDAARWRARSVGSGDLSDIIFTSGTTGRPKGVMTTHAQSLRTFATWSSIVGLREGDRYLVVNPFFHTFGYKAGILASLMQGATIVPVPVFDVDRVLEVVEAERISVLPGPPTLFSSILDHPRRDTTKLDSLRLAVTGAASVPVELVRRMGAELSFETVLTAYGLTESTGVVTMCRQGDDAEIIAATSGRAIPGIEVRVVADDGTEQASGEPGEIVVRGYTVTSGYYEDPVATAEAIDAGGWLHTGDVGVKDERGNVKVTDRTKDMYIVGGFNAYPAEIEGYLARHPKVSQVAVVGVPDERLGEVGCAFVVPRPGADADRLADELVAFARDQMANYKVPRHVRVTDALPLNASGKVQKVLLRDRFAAEQADHADHAEHAEHADRAGRATDGPAVAP